MILNIFPYELDDERLLRSRKYDKKGNLIEKKKGSQKGNPYNDEILDHSWIGEKTSKTTTYLHTQMHTFTMKFWEILFLYSNFISYTIRARFRQTVW